MKRTGPMLAALLAAGCAAGPEMPDDQRAADSHAGAGLHLIAQAQPEAARSRLERALQIDGEHPQALSGMGLVAESQGDLEMAHEYHRRAAQAAPDSGPILNNRGRSLCRAGQVDEALEVFGDAAGAGGYDSAEVPLTNAARCALDAGREDAAARRADAAVEAAPGFAPARVVRGELRYRQGALEAAAEDLERARDSGGAGARGLYWSARVAAEQGRPEEAAAFAEMLAERFPGSGWNERLHADEVGP
ncbi:MULTISPECIES: tetratricopeptide repeat protein [unclassified Halorhodospira]|uniref:tetratricopeptide repeat protein n=1 Tax=unclassified Halorhodospira TaxID=2626748 RepID=UPI001EE8D887|nr:tetratricopeptide repeat protein [Halorhodospira sp. M39old]MCG5545329.1 tetratricopeptide repeat protein [Halorhodospira sp. M38]